MIKMLFLLVCGHCLADTALQPEKMEIGKNRNRPIDPSRVPPGQKVLKLWWMWLGHHAFIHAGVVCLVTGSLLFGIIEVISHWVIDFLKCDNWYTPYEDQIFHLGIKVIYVILYIGGIK